MRNWRGGGFSGEKCPKRAYLGCRGPVGGGPVEATTHRPVGGGPVKATPHSLYQCLTILLFFNVANYYLPPKCTSVTLSSSTFPGVSKHAIGNSREDPSQKTPNGWRRWALETAETESGHPWVDCPHDSPTYMHSRFWGVTQCQKAQCFPQAYTCSFLVEARAS